MNFWSFNEPERVFGICFPHQEIFHQLFVIFIGAFHMQIRQEFNQRPIRVPLDVILIGQHPAHLRHAHPLVHQQRLGRSVLAKHFDKDLLDRSLFDLFDGNPDLFRLGIAFDGELNVTVQLPQGHLVGFVAAAAVTGGGVVAEGGVVVRTVGPFRHQLDRRVLGQLVLPDHLRRDVLGLAGLGHRRRLGQRVPQAVVGRRRRWQRRRQDVVRLIGVEVALQSA